MAEAKSAPAVGKSATTAGPKTRHRRPVRRSITTIVAMVIPPIFAEAAVPTSPVAKTRNETRSGKTTIMRPLIQTCPTGPVTAASPSKNACGWRCAQLPTAKPNPSATTEAAVIYGGISNFMPGLSEFRVIPPVGAMLMPEVGGSLHATTMLLALSPTTMNLLSKEQTRWDRCPFVREKQGSALVSLPNGRRHL